MKKSAAQSDQSASQLIDARIKELGDWRGEMLSRLRALIREAGWKRSRASAGRKWFPGSTR
jgi:hypothetical protein